MTMWKSISLSAVLLTTALVLPAQAHPNSEAAAKAPFDVQYLDSMTKHHQDGIMMFEMAVQKAAMPAVKSKAQIMADMQNKDNAEMQKLREAAGAGADKAVNMQMPGMMMMDMSLLRSSSGMAFDHAFIDMTVHHHEGAIKMSKHALARSKTPEVRAMAQKIIDDSEKDIADLTRIKGSMS